VEQVAASQSCPRCGAECRAGGVRCRACGFALVDDAGHRESRRRSGRAARFRLGRAAAPALAAACVAAAVVAILLVAARDGSPPAAPASPPAPVTALEAERRLELRYGGASDDETASVRCPRRIEPGGLVRCELRYSDGIPRAMLVRLTPRGELEADIPYPATLRR
jgi:hypothetical protein